MHKEIIKSLEKRCFSDEYTMVLRRKQKKTVLCKVDLLVNFREQLTQVRLSTAERRNAFVSSDAARATLINSAKVHIAKVAKKAFTDAPNETACETGDVYTNIVDLVETKLTKDRKVDSLHVSNLFCSKLSSLDSTQETVFR